MNVKNLTAAGNSSLSNSKARILKFQVFFGPNNHQKNTHSQCDKLWKFLKITTFINIVTEFQPSKNVSFCFDFQDLSNSESRILKFQVFLGRKITKKVRIHNVISFENCRKSLFHQHSDRILTIEKRFFLFRFSKFITSQNP